MTGEMGFVDGHGLPADRRVRTKHVAARIADAAHGIERGLNVLVGNHVAQAVRAQQVEVVLLDWELRHIHVDRGVDTERPGHVVLAGRPFGLRARIDPAVHQLFEAELKKAGAVCHMKDMVRACPGVSSRG